MELDVVRGCFPNVFETSRHPTDGKSVKFAKSFICPVVRYCHLRINNYLQLLFVGIIALRRFRVDDRI